MCQRIWALRSKDYFPHFTLATKVTDLLIFRYFRGFAVLFHWKYFQLKFTLCNICTTFILKRPRKQKWNSLRVERKMSKNILHILLAHTKVSTSILPCSSTIAWSFNQKCNRWNLIGIFCYILCVISSFKCCFNAKVSSERNNK